jgi:phenylacetate-coenzyme A ligase PaaK-like adenylate-forming protein
LSSGTSGKPKVVGATVDDLKRDKRQCEQAYNCFIEEGDVVLNCFPSSPAISGVASIEGIKSFQAKLFQAPAQALQNVETFLLYYDIFKPNVVFGLTTSLYRLPFRLREIGVSPEKLGIKKMMSGAEPSTTERRKAISEDFGGAKIYDWYASSENMVIAYEEEPFSNRYNVTLPETILFLTKENDFASAGETGQVLLTNLYEVGEKPHMILLNYLIGDFARCVEKDEETGFVTVIGDIRREAAYLAGAKLNPQEVEAIIDGLSEVKGFLTGEYCIITYNDADRKAVAEVRLEARKQLSNKQKEQISQKVRQKIYSVNFPVWDVCENVKDAKLIINITEPGSLYKGYEQHAKPGKPKRLIVL